MIGLEIERKYLIAYPDERVLSAHGAEVSVIEQTYLKSEKSVTERVRKRQYAGRTEYTHNRKIKMDGISRKEEENEISEEEYNILLKRKEKGTRTIRKKRYVLFEKGFTYEIDLFDFWTDKAFLEIELSNADIVPPLPEYVTVLADVSLDGRYTNQALARQSEVLP